MQYCVDFPVEGPQVLGAVLQAFSLLQHDWCGPASAFAVPEAQRMAALVQHDVRPVFMNVVLAAQF